jgi:predicted esterase
MSAATRASTLCLLAGTLVWLAPSARSQQAATGLLTDVVFSSYSALSSNSELVRRLLSPLGAAQVAANLESEKRRLIEQSIDLSTERFVLYVPAQAPAGGFRLLVFLPPWQDALLPPGWAHVLDQYGTILASAARSGNDEHVLARREPLALLAAVNVMQRYPVDAAHVYVGGFSGGARIAERLALGYPDLFHGALLNAGSDPLGDPAAGAPPLPPRDLLERFQQSTRVVYVTGERDISHLSMDANSLQSLRRWCVFDVETQTMVGAGHQLATPEALAAALHALLAPVDANAAKLGACRAGIDRDLSAQLGRVEALTAAGRRAEARKLLAGIDLRFGGLAAPRSLELLEKLK